MIEIICYRVRGATHNEFSYLAKLTEFVEENRNLHKFNFACFICCWFHRPWERILPGPERKVSGSVAVARFSNHCIGLFCSDVCVRVGGVKQQPFAVDSDKGVYSHHHRRTRRGSGAAAAPPGLKMFRANSVFRASASCSKNPGW